MTNSLGSVPLARTRLRALALAAAIIAAPAGAYDWPQFNGDAAHSGNNTAETAITRGNVASLALEFQVDLPDVADGAPVVLQGAATPAGPRDLLFVTTRAGHIVALDAQTGAQAWVQQYGPGSCRVNNVREACFTTSSPALDPDRLHVYSYGLDGYVHKYRVADGVEVIGGGWPQLATTKGYEEKGSSALAIATARGVSRLYVTHGGYPGDAGDYQGHVTAIDLATGAQRVFNASCSDAAVHFVHSPGSPDCANVQTAIWARPGVVYDAGTDRLFMSTGNGSYTGNSGGTNWGDSVFALNPDGTGAGGRPLDAYTPRNFQQLNDGDVDLGSTAPAILPSPVAAPRRHLGVQSGKDGLLRLLDLSDLSGQGGPGHVGGEIGTIGVPQGGEVLTQPAVWVNPEDGASWVFVANASGIAGLRLAFGSDGTPSLQPQWQRAEGGTSPLVANGVLYYGSTGALRALDPATGATLASSNLVAGLHWQSPVVANGILYMSDERAKLTAFAAPAAIAKNAVIEFYNAALDHYFLSASQADIDALDAGTSPGWVRTGLALAAFAQAGPNANPVCRFYLPPAFGDSHFYSVSGDECATVAAKYPFFDLETSAAFFMGTPDPSTGACAAGTVPVYRVWNNRPDGNHRYTVSRAVRDQMIATGWIAEGYGNDGVVMCSPA